MSIRPTFLGIEIGKTGLAVSQKGLDVTGHNISNADTLGYTRQRIVSTAHEPFNAVTQFKPVDRALVGTGSYVMIHDQIRSVFYDRQFRTEQSLYSYWSTRTQGLTYVESLFEGDDMNELSECITSMFEAFNTLTNESNDAEQRKLIQQSAINLSTQFHLIYERLVDQQTDQDKAVSAITDEINSMAESIAVLNNSIYVFERNSDLIANDLRDKRNLLLDQLSELVDIEYEETAEEKMIVKIGGVNLVNHTSTNKLVCKKEANVVAGGEDVNVVYWEKSGEKLNITTGELKARIDLRDHETSDTPGIPYFIEQLNILARALAQAVNEVHVNGWTHYSNAEGTSRQGQLFFVADGETTTAYKVDPSDPDSKYMTDPAYYSKITAGNLCLSPDIVDDIYKIAASDAEMSLSSGSTTIPANNENARKLYELLNSKTLTLDTGNGKPITLGSFQSFTTNILIDVATTLRHSKDLTDTQGTLLLSVDTLRTSISGVSLDEEMTSLIKYQHSYQGASRVITAMDEALEVLINKMGLVGRS